MNLRKKYKIPNFSNPYGLHNKSVISIISSKRRKSSLSPSLHHRISVSPTSSHLASISNVPYIEKYRKNTKLALGKQKLQKIKYSLEIQEQSKKKMLERLKKKNLYFKYQNSSLSKSVSAKNRVRDKSIDISNKSICRAIKQLHQKDIMGELNQRATRRQLYIQNAEMCISKLKNSLERSKDVVSQQIKENFYVFDASPIFGNMNIVQASLFQDLDKIVSMKQDNFFNKQIKSRDINLFHLITQPNHPSFRSGWDQLAQLHFNYEPTNNANNKRFNQQIFNNLSTFTRIAVKNRLLKPSLREAKTTILNKSLEDESLTTENMFLISNGLLTPEQILNTKIQNKHHQESSGKPLENITNVTVNRSHQNNKATNKYEDTSKDKTEIEYYNQLPLTDKERRTSLLSQQCLQMIRKIIDNQAKCRKNTIYQKALQEKFERQKNEAMMEQVEGIRYAGRPDFNNVEKKVRLNKLSKNKCENIKIQDTSRIYRQKKLLELKFKPIPERQKHKI